MALRTNLYRDPPTEAACTGCGETKPVSAFHTGQNLSAYCRTCAEEYLRVRPYGITLERYREMQERQKGCCAICQQEAPLNIDHDHVTGRVRGLLCRACNLGLGLFDDDRRRLRRALAYLK